MLNNYKCVNCDSEHTIIVDEGIKCESCKSFFKFNELTGCYNFLRKEDDDLLLKEINLEDLQEEEAREDSQIRLYSEEDYIQSDYAGNLVREFNLKEGALILDHGCGRGHFSKMFSDLGYKVFSADILEDAMSKLESKNKSVCNLTKLPYKDNTFDGVFSLDVFEHLIPKSMDNVINEIYRVLKPGGILLISFPGNRIPDFIGIHILNIFVFFLRLFGSNYPYMRSNNIRAHINLHPPSKFKKSFKKAGFLGEIRPYSNKFMTLPRSLVFLAKILNFSFLAPIFIHQMHGYLKKPKNL